MMYFKGLAVGMAMLSCIGPVAAADFSDPTWPCIQRKVERLSIGLMWPEPLAETALPADSDAAADELAQTLALRRVDLDAAQAAVDAFTRTQGSDMALMGAVFARVFDTLSARRTRIMKGIGEFSLSQIALSDRIDTARTAMDEQMTLEAPDYDKLDTLEEQIDWDQRIFTDRQKTISYLCETPTLLEKRLYAIAQMLHRSGQGGGN